MAPSFICVKPIDSAVQTAYKVLIPTQLNPWSLYQLMIQSNISFEVFRPSPKRLGSILLALFPFLYLMFTYRMLKTILPGSGSDGVGKNGRDKRFLKQKSSKWWAFWNNCKNRTSLGIDTHEIQADEDQNDVRQTSVSFQDIGGIDDARKELEEIVDFLHNPGRYQAIGARVPRGILLCGPSGTGKTLLARALAAEANIAFLFCSASDFVEMLVGRGAARVRDLFTQAASYERCIIFIDEIDALAKARGGINSNDEREQTLNQLLTEMDGFAGSESNRVIVIGATNRPQVLDPALCRPGRFDRHVYVGLPDQKGRLDILRLHTRRVKLGDDVDLICVAEKCGIMGQQSGAELANLVNEAALLAVRHGHACVRQEHFDLALSRAHEAASR
uniref:Cell division protease ftsH putative n=1 Tax=Albugo laibachii Nc14 TaxID=890382 RepID=F0WEM8_9STRA|nr:cell division protease ftsH putative [Albugo laibachii Nc14]CCA23092.1 cell division protease ftsH putative [Albugo laibachii Nc14]|eukprot:CCA23092.1 cell division protease ftsH putative [Albugo laibachii Nc14]